MDTRVLLSDDLDLNRFTLLCLIGTLWIDSSFNVWDFKPALSQIVLNDDATEG